MNKAFPQKIKEQHWKFLFGLVRIHYLVEDRRPDLGEHIQHLTKYKHYITVLVGYKRFNWVFHTKHPYDDEPYITNKAGKQIK